MTKPAVTKHVKVLECAGLLTREIDGRVHRCEIDPAKTLLIGDTAHDAEVAERLGTDCLLIAAGHHSYDRLVRLGHPVLASLDELEGHFVSGPPD